MKSKIIFLILVFILLAVNVSGEIIPLKTCGPPNIIDNGNSFTLFNDCLLSEFEKDYNPIIYQYDIINDESFMLHLQGLEERRPIGARNQVPFSTLGFKATAIGNNKIVYTSLTSPHILTYTLDGNRLKAGAEIRGYNYLWSDSELYIETIIHKSSSSTIYSTDVIVDGVSMPVEEETIQRGANTFLAQRLYRGSDIVLDPIFVVNITPIPAEHLLNGSNNLDNDTDYEQMLDITSGVSDDSDSTTYETRIGSSTYTKQTYNDGVFETTDFLGSAGDAFGVLFPIPDLNTINDNITVCMQVSENGVATNRLRINNTVTGINFPTQIGNSPTAFSCLDVDKSNFDKGNNIIGLECLSGCTNPLNRIWIDGDTTSPDSTSYDDVGAGWVLDVTVDYAINISYNLIDSTKGFSISGNWDETYDPQYDWYLRIKKTSSGTSDVNVYAYETNISLAPLNISQSLIGTGWFNINISNLVDYETNSANLTYTKLRFYSVANDYFSEVRLRKETNDTTLPSINAYSINDTNITCGNSVLLSANVTDNLDVASVTFTINNSFTSGTMKNGDIYTSIFTPFGDADTTFNWTNITATDIANNVNNFDPNLNFDYFCNSSAFINITNVQVNNITNESALITWDTSTLSDSEVNFGFVPFNLSNHVNNSILTINHIIPLIDLPSDTTIYFLVHSSASGISQTDGVYSFNTLESIQPDFTCESFTFCTDGFKECTFVGDANNLTPFVGNVTDFDESCISLRTDNMFWIILIYVIVFGLILFGIRYRELWLSMIGAFLGIIISLAILWKFFFIALFFVFLFIVLFIVFFVMVFI